MLVDGAVAVELEGHEEVGLSVPGGGENLGLVAVLLQAQLGLFVWEEKV